MRLASFNVENLFDRPKAMNLGSWADGKPVLEAFARLNELLGEANYTDSRKQRMADLMIQLGLEKSDEGPFVILRRNRGSLLKRPRAGGLEITASGRADWAGSLELIEAPIDAEAMRNTARVMIELQADILAVVEAESRPALAAFNREILGALGGPTFHHVMVIDGNDSRGIDVGVLSGAPFPIDLMRSHVDDRGTNGEPLFSRDCPEFGFNVGGQRLWVLVNHLKSKGYGSKASSDARRHAQAERVRVIYEGLRAAGETRVAIVGDFNDTPDSATLAPLLQQTNLRDVFEHPGFDNGGYAGTYGLCSDANKIDYILLSPDLFSKIEAGGVFRRGMWPGTRPVRWDVFPELTSPEQSASDHAAVWVDLQL